MKIAAVLFLLLAVMAFEAAGAEGLSDRPMKEIDAGEILEKIQEGQPVEYDHVVVRGDLDLSRERLQKNITSYIRINDSIFKDLVSFKGSTLEMPVDLSGSNFTSDAYFRWATLSGDADFRGATFIGRSRFEDAEFDGNIEFGDARFENETSFYRILFKRPAYFENCTIESLNLTKAEYGRLHLRWDGIESLHFDEAAYLALIKNYNTLGWYGDANRCYYDYRNAVRKDWQDASSPGFAEKVSSPLDRLVDFGEWLLYGYGVRPSFPIAWCIGIILAFGLLLPAEEVPAKDHHRGEDRGCQGWVRRGAGGEQGQESADKFPRSLSLQPLHLHLRLHRLPSARRGIQAGALPEMGHSGEASRPLLAGPGDNHHQQDLSDKVIVKLRVFPPAGSINKKSLPFEEVIYYEINFYKI